MIFVLLLLLLLRLLSLLLLLRLRLLLLLSPLLCTMRISGQWELQLLQCLLLADELLLLFQHRQALVCQPLRQLLAVKLQPFAGRELGGRPFRHLLVKL